MRVVSKEIVRDRVESLIIRNLPSGSPADASPPESVGPSRHLVWSRRPRSRSGPPLAVRVCHRRCGLVPRHRRRVSETSLEPRAQRLLEPVVLMGAGMRPMEKAFSPRSGWSRLVRRQRFEMAGRVAFHLGCAHEELRVGNELLHRADVYVTRTEAR